MSTIELKRVDDHNYWRARKNLMFSVRMLVVVIVAAFLGYLVTGKIKEPAAVALAFDFEKLTEDHKTLHQTIQKLEFRVQTLTNRINSLEQNQWLTIQPSNSWLTYHTLDIPTQ